jgi:hypothetical protein
MGKRYLEGLILFGESSLRAAVQNFVAHCHGERNHQGLSNRLLFPDPDHLRSAVLLNVASDRADPELLLPGCGLITHHAYGQPVGTAGEACTTISGMAAPSGCN